MKKSKTAIIDVGGGMRGIYASGVLDCCLEQGIPYYDGALSDPVPVKRALKLGCEKIVVILTLPAMTIREPGMDLKLAARIEQEFPHAAEKMRFRADEYNRSINFARKCAKEGRVKIIAPDDTCGVDTLTRDSLNLSRLYEKGRRDGEKIREFMYESPDTV